MDTFTFYSLLYIYLLSDNMFLASLAKKRKCKKACEEDYEMLEVHFYHFLCIITIRKKDLKLSLHRRNFSWSFRKFSEAFLSNNYQQSSGGVL